MKNFMPLIAITFLIVTFLFFWDSQPEYFINKTNKAAISDEAPKADNYMSNVELTQFSESGSPELLITASSSRYFEKNNYAEMDDPHLTSFDEEQASQPWELTAQKGVAFGNNDKLVFTEKVRMWQYTQVDATNELLTEQLIVYPEEKLAHSDTWVELSNQQGTTTGRKMDANLNNKTFTLHNNVKGVHLGL